MPLPRRSPRTRPRPQSLPRQTGPKPVAKARCKKARWRQSVAQKADKKPKSCCRRTGVQSPVHPGGKSARGRVAPSVRFRQGCPQACRIARTAGAEAPVVTQKNNGRNAPVVSQWPATGADLPRRWCTVACASRVARPSRPQPSKAPRRWCVPKTHSRSQAGGRSAVKPFRRPRRPPCPGGCASTAGPPDAPFPSDRW